MISASDLPDDIDQLKEILLSINNRYCSAMEQLSELRSLLMNVKHEDLCSTVKERELSLMNSIEINKQNTRVYMHKCETALHELPKLPENFKVARILGYSGNIVDWIKNSEKGFV